VIWEWARARQTLVPFVSPLLVAGYTQLPCDDYIQHVAFVLKMGLGDPGSDHGHGKKTQNSLMSPVISIQFQAELESRGVSGGISQGVIFD
jgi:hypothetical protein